MGILHINNNFKEESGVRISDITTKKKVFKILNKKNNNNNLVFLKSVVKSLKESSLKKEI